MKAPLFRRKLLVIIFLTEIILLSSLTLTRGYDLSEPIIADHTIANMVRLDEIPDSAIITAKNTLHIAYQHTSHGSQIIDGMNALPVFKEGLGGTVDLYDYNSTFLQDGTMPA